VALIEAYLLRCEQVPGEVEGLITSDSSGGSGRRSSSDDSDESYDQEDGEGSGYGDEEADQPSMTVEPRV